VLRTFTSLLEVPSPYLSLHHQLTLCVSIWNICPNSDLSVIGIPTWFDAEQNALLDEQLSASASNCSIIDSSPSACVSTYSFAIEGSKWWNPFSVSTGTMDLTDMAGSLTVPPWGTTETTVSILAYTTVVTPAAYKDAAAGTTAVTGSFNSGSSSVATKTTTSGSESTTTAASKNTGNTASAETWKVCLVVVFVLAASYVE
jgi:hypothetical protein